MSGKALDRPEEIPVIDGRLRSVDYRIEGTSR